MKDDSEGDDFEPADGDLDDEEEEEEAGESEEGMWSEPVSSYLSCCHSVDQFAQSTELILVQKNSVTVSLTVNMVYSKFVKTWHIFVLSW